MEDARWKIDPDLSDINYFKELLKSIHDYDKIFLLIFIIKKDNDLLLESGMPQKFIDKLYNGCKKVLDNEIDDYNDHIKNLEESILEKINNY